MVSGRLWPVSSHHLGDVFVFAVLTLKLIGFCSNQLRVASTLKQKMASFQNLMDVEESQVYDLLPRPDSSTGGCIRTEDDLSGEAASLPQD